MVTLPVANSLCESCPARETLFLLNKLAHLFKGFILPSECHRVRNINLAFVHRQGLNFLAPARNPLRYIVVGVLAHILEVIIASLSKCSKHRSLQSLRRSVARCNLRPLFGNSFRLLFSYYPNESINCFFGFSDGEAHGRALQ